MTPLPAQFRDKHPSPIQLGCMSRQQAGRPVCATVASTRLTIMAILGIGTKKVTNTQSVHIGTLSLHRLHVIPLLHRNGVTCNLNNLSATLGLHSLHVRPLLRRDGATCTTMQSVQIECRTQLAHIACQTSPAQEWCDMQSVQAECNTQVAQISMSDHSCTGVVSHAIRAN